MFRDYQRACREGYDGWRLTPGDAFGYETSPGRFTYNVTTKDHWRAPSCREWIDFGLHHLLVARDEHVQVTKAFLNDPASVLHQLAPG